MEEPSSFKRFMVQIWPSIYRTINAIFFNLLFFLRTNIKRAIAQIFGQI